jgi:hypothetical protein
MDRRIIGLALFGVAALLGSAYYLCDAIYHSGAVGKNASTDYWHHWSLGGLPLLLPTHFALWVGLAYFVTGEIEQLMRLFRRRRPEPEGHDEVLPPAGRDETRFRQ